MAPASPAQYETTHGRRALFLGARKEDGDVSLAFAWIKDGAVFRLRIGRFDADRLREALTVRPARNAAATMAPASRRKGIIPALRDLLFGSGDPLEDFAQRLSSAKGGDIVMLPVGMHFIPSGSEHQANESGNLGKGLSNDPDNVPENRNIGAATAACRLDPRNLSQPLVSVAPGIVRGIERASYPAEALEFFRSADPARNSRAQAEECTASLPRSPSNSRQGD